MFLTRLLAGVPKYRTSKPKVLRRRFFPQRILALRPLALCSECGAVHSPWVVCMQCYRVLREATEPLKRRMQAYNPYLGQRPRPLEGEPDWERSSRT